MLPTVSPMDRYVEADCNVGGRSLLRCKEAGYWV